MNTDKHGSNPESPEPDYGDPDSPEYPTRAACEACGGDGLSREHECGEDTCCCMNPEPNVPCDECGGSGEVDELP